MERRALCSSLSIVLLMGVVLCPLPAIVAERAADGAESCKRCNANPIADFTVTMPGIIAFSDPSVLFDGGIYHLWFSCNDGKASQICHATSADGIRWSPDPAPVIRVGRRGSWDDCNTEVPTVIKDSQLFHMWYAGYSCAKRNYYRIGYATSTDGIHWERLPDNKSPYGQEGLVLFPNGQVEGELLAVADPEVIKVGNTLHMFYGGFGYNKIVISHATSSDGIHWQRDEKNPVLRPSLKRERSPWGENREGSVVQPAVLYDKGIFKMWYGSFDDKHWRYPGIFQAQSYDASVWVKDPDPALSSSAEPIWTGLSVVRLEEEIRLYYICLDRGGTKTRLCMATCEND